MPSQPPLNSDILKPLYKCFVDAFHRRHKSFYRNVYVPTGARKTTHFSQAFKRKHRNGQAGGATTATNRRSRRKRRDILCSLRFLLFLASGGNPESRRATPAPRPINPEILKPLHKPTLMRPVVVANFLTAMTYVSMTARKPSSFCKLLTPDIAADLHPPSSFILPPLAEPEGIV